MFCRYSQLELLSTIQEIYGPVRIQGLPISVTSFPYLRNLRLIDTSNSTVKLNLGCQSGETGSCMPAVDMQALKIITNYI